MKFPLSDSDNAKHLSINGNLGLITGLVRFPGEGNGNLQYTLENPMDRREADGLQSMG